MKEYNGYKNYQTWNIALWINNDERFYNIAKGCLEYSEFIYMLRSMDITETFEQVAFNDSGLDIDRLDEMIRDTK